MKIQKQLQEIIWNTAPFLVSVLEPVSRIYIGWKFDSMDTESVFTQIYKKNYWGGYSRSGPGSDLDQTRKIIKEIPRVLKHFGVKSILDVPCGDFNWQKHADFGFVDYVGADIVGHIVQRNNKMYSNSKRKFVKLDIRRDKLPCCDLILCRDLFQHLSFEDIWKAISNIKSSGCKYLLASSQINADKNSDITTGGWRRLNLLHPPFSFPSPILILDEGCPVKYHADKSLMLWKINDLK